MSKTDARGSKVPDYQVWTSKMPKIMAQYPKMRQYRQYTVHCFGAILPRLSLLGCWAIVLGIWEVHVYVNYEKTPEPLEDCLEQWTLSQNSGYMVIWSIVLGTLEVELRGDHLRYAFHIRVLEPLGYDHWSRSDNIIGKLQGLMPKSNFRHGVSRSLVQTPKQLQTPVLRCIFGI